jgi:hypothetical protein
MEAWFIIYLVVAGLAVIQAGLFTFQAFENRRFARARCRRQETKPATGHAVLVAPCKGDDTELRQNLSYLLAQDYADYEVRFVVESDRDPALAVIHQVLGERPQRRASICIAGKAEHSGQKVHNLLAATANLPLETRFLAFVDSDARPSPQWLRCLISRFEDGRPKVVSGYRWFVPARTSLANLLLANINANVAGLLGPGEHHFVWGGSWAIERQTFDHIRLREAWQGTLSDDLVATRVLRKKRIPIEFEPRCLVPSPLDVDFGQLFEFLRRQYLIGRFYATRWWLGALAITLLAVGTLWASPLVALIAGARRLPLAWAPAVVFVTLYASHAFRAWLRQDMARHALTAFCGQLTASRRFDLCAAPLAGLVNTVGLLSSLVGNTISWRGIRYRIFRGGRTQRLNDLCPLVIAESANHPQRTQAPVTRSRRRLSA